MAPIDPLTPTPSPPSPIEWHSVSFDPGYAAHANYRPSRKQFLLALLLFFLTLATCLAAGSQFAAAYAQDRALSMDEFVRSLQLLFFHPASLLPGLPFALTLLTILLAHEMGHWFACRKHHIRASYPYFIPAPTLIGTLGAFILIRSPIRSRRALFDVGASGPVVGFCFAIPALAYGILHAKVIPGLAAQSELVFGVPLALRFMGGILRPGIAPHDLLLHPVGRAAWVGLFATALNLLPTGQLDGGHILRCFNERWHSRTRWLLPFCLAPLGYFLWAGWYLWAALLLGLSFLRAVPIYDPEPLDPARRFGAVIALIIFALCFMPAPL